MAEKIGKYLVFERIGRGGMGTIYKAHDPILDRPVAVKVISSEVEVTDGLRARFFREAQACARLSHPNIVTVYDMGEENGRLYIVMELLEGEELKRLIAQRTAMAIEEKISIIAQVCDGLHYAHQKGVVHRDIKPGNIMLLRNGQVKILDFGIAQIANTEGDLTRTGLIMGTLRYIAPEQVRGRADSRSDIFSVGAVFYEFLSSQPPFSGDDPMQLLEQLRTEEPTPLDQVDPGIPPELARIVERAMRKHPEERFPNLQQMRVRLDQVQRGLADEARRIGERMRGECDQLRELQAELAERIGPLGAEEALPALELPGSVAALQALEREIGARIQSTQARIERADAFAPAFERGTELREAGQFADAVVELAAIAAEMPEHARAAEGLRQARAGAEAERRRQLTTQLLQDARQALSEGEYTLCVEILKQVVEVPAPEEALREIAALRETAEKLTAVQAARRAREQAEQSRERMAQARRAAQAEAAAEYAPALWNEAEMKSAEAQEALAAEQYGQGGQAFEAATAGYDRSAEAAREAQRRARQALDRARGQAERSREVARAAGAPQYARERWDTAEVKFAEAEATRRAQGLARASILVADLFAEAERRYTAAARAAGMAAEAETRRVDALLAEASLLLASADVPACLGRVNEVLALRPGDIAAERLRVQAEERQRESAAAAATALLAPAPNAALSHDQPLPRAEAASSTDRTDTIAPLASTETAADPIPVETVVVPIIAEPGVRSEDSPFLAGTDALEPIDTESGRGWSWGRWARGILTVGAAVAVVVVVTVYGLPRLTSPVSPPAQQRAATTPSGDGTPQTTLPPAAPNAGAGGRDPVDELRKQVSVARDEAARAKAESLAPAQLAAAAEKARQGDAVLAQQQTAVARQHYQEALQGYTEAKAEAEARAVERRAGEAKRAGERVNAASVEGKLWAKAVSTQRGAEEALKQRAFDRAQRLFGEAEEGYRLAAKTALSTPSPLPDRVASPKPPEPRDTPTGARKNAEQARTRMASVRRAAEEVAAAYYAPKLFSSARAKEDDGAAALARSDYESAVRLFSEAQSDYQAAAQEAKPGAEAARQEAIAQESRATTISRRAEARTAGADRLAKDVFELAQSKHLEADRLDKGRNFPAAAQAYRDAAKLYQEATQASQR